MFVATNLLDDHLCGIWTRIIIAGVKRHQILMCHFVQGFAVFLVHLVSGNIFSSFFFADVKDLHSLVTINAIFLLCGVYGIVTGILLSSCFKSAVAGMILIQALMACSWLSGGIFWPIECQPKFMQNLSNYSPFTVCVKAVKDIAFKNSSIVDSSVKTAVIVMSFSILITCVLIIVAIFITKNK